MPRANLVITGSELVRGERTDLNGPFLARELHALGVEPVRIALVGDSPDDLEQALREGFSADLCVVTGGLGPTHDDRTVEVLARAHAPERRVLRFFGASESAVAKALADAGGDGGGVEATICARDFEIHVDLFVEPGAEARADELSAQLVAPLEQYLFSRDERPVEALVLDLCHVQGLSLATAESCTGGMAAQRLTSVPGSSRVFRGAVFAYSDDVKAQELGVPRELLERHGAVSAEVAEAMAVGARKRLGADVAVSITGIAGPDGGTPEKP